MPECGGGRAGFAALRFDSGAGAVGGAERGQLQWAGQADAGDGDYARTLWSGFMFGAIAVAALSNAKAI